MSLGNPSEAKVRRLENGLTVVTKSMPNRVVTIDVWVKAGSAYENDEINGVSHFLEHMMFKGTERYGVGELDKLITSVGGVWNAATSMDFTHYHVTVGAAFFDVALDAISEMIQRPTLDPKEFEKEREVILEEFRRKQDDPWGFLFDELYGVAYAAGPYRRTVLGTFESISNLKHSQLVDYYRRMYAPSNMSVLIVGDVDPEDAYSAVARSFQQFHRPFEEPALPESETRYNCGRRVTYAKDVSEVYLAIVLPAPSLEKRRDVLAMDVAATILGEGRSSRLYRKLKHELQLVDTIWAGFPTHRFESVFYVGATCDEARAERAVAEAISVIRGLRVSPPSEEELAKAKRVLRNEFCFATETTTGQSSMIGYYLTLTGGLEFYERYLGEVMSITREDVVSCVTDYLLSEETVVSVTPKSGTHSVE